MTLNGAGRILIVDDDADTRWLLARACETANYVVGQAGTGEEALASLDEGPFDVMVLDLHLPDMEGIEVLDEIAAAHPHLITIVLTANPTQDSAIAALKTGVADYLQKPLKTKDVLCVIALKLEQRAQRQRKLIALQAFGDEIVGEKEGKAQPNGATAMTSGGRAPARPRVRLDADRHEVKILGEDSQRVTLTKGETAVLEVLLRKAGDVLSYQALAYEAWGDQLEPDHAASIIRPLIFRLRQKLEPEPSVPRLIRTVRGVGYMFQIPN
ncbi:MAG TPA: response regulator transcription factor [Candidatus Binatia bacterium]|jgi:DNA-binding response OmpR family regulator|nr:response regulator transcription factor [Candidatus Binatia bacterium]